MVPPNAFIKAISYLFPVKVRKSSSAWNPVLELFFYKGEYQLATEDAIYSDGCRYRPLVEAFSHIKGELQKVQHVLILGAGLGSGPVILKKMGFRPKITLVDIDDAVLGWAKELMDGSLLQDVEFIHADAEKFIKDAPDNYDILVIDVFNGRKVPDFITGEDFLSRCAQKLTSTSILVINYMLASEEDWLRLQANVGKIFTSSHIISIGINKVLIAKASQTEF